MKISLLLLAVEAVLSRVGADVMKIVADKILDACERAIEDSATQWDDRILMPVIMKAREAFDIPDED